MEHFNPLLKGNDKANKFITIGEIMLRLTPPNYEKIRTAQISRRVTAAARRISHLRLQIWA